MSVEAAYLGCLSGRLQASTLNLIHTYRFNITKCGDKVTQILSKSGKWGFKIINGCNSISDADFYRFLKSQFSIIHVKKF